MSIELTPEGGGGGGGDAIAKFLSTLTSLVEILGKTGPGGTTSDESLSAGQAPNNTKIIAATQKLFQQMAQAFKPLKTVLEQFGSVGGKAKKSKKTSKPAGKTVMPVSAITIQDASIGIDYASVKLPAGPKPKKGADAKDGENPPPPQTPQKIGKILADKVSIQTNAINVKADTSAFKLPTGNFNIKTALLEGKFMFPPDAFAGAAPAPTAADDNNKTLLDDKNLVKIVDVLNQSKIVQDNILAAFLKRPEPTPATEISATSTPLEQSPQTATQPTQAAPKAAPKAKAKDTGMFGQATEVLGKFSTLFKTVYTFLAPKKTPTKNTESTPNSKEENPAKDNPMGEQQKEMQQQAAAVQSATISIQNAVINVANQTKTSQEKPKEPEEKSNEKAENSKAEPAENPVKNATGEPPLPLKETAPKPTPASAARTGGAAAGEAAGGAAAGGATGGAAGGAAAGGAAAGGAAAGAAGAAAAAAAAAIAAVVVVAVAAVAVAAAAAAPAVMYLADKAKMVGKTLAAAITDPVDTFRKLTAQLSTFVAVVNPAAVMMLNRSFMDLNAVIGRSFIDSINIATTVVKEFAGLLKPIMDGLTSTITALAMSMRNMFFGMIRFGAMLINVLMPVIKAVAYVFGMIFDMIGVVTDGLAVFFAGFQGLFGGIDGVAKSMTEALTDAVKWVVKYTLMFVGIVAKLFGATSFVDKMAAAAKNKGAKDREDTTGLAAPTNAGFQASEAFGKNIAQASFTATSAGEAPKKTDDFLEDIAADMEAIAALDIKQIIVDAVASLPGAIAKAISDGAKETLKPGGAIYEANPLKGIGEAIGNKIGKMIYG